MASTVMSLHFNFYTQQSGTVSLPLRVGFQRYGSAAVETLVQKKIQRAKVGDFEPLDLAVAQAFKVLLHALGRDLFDQDRIILGLQCDQPNVDGVAFVPGSRVRDFYESDLHQTVT